MKKRIEGVNNWFFSLPVIRKFKRIIRYVIIGSTAAVVQMVVFALLLIIFEFLASGNGALNSSILILAFGSLKIFEIAALIIAIECAIITGFNGQRLYTFRDRKDNDTVKRQFAKFQLVALSTVIGQTILYAFFRTRVFAEPTLGFRLLSQALAIILMFMVNFTINYFFIFSKKNSRER